MLKSEINTEAVRKEIGAAARKHFHKRNIDVFFEHGQWWIIPPSGAAYSVNDSVTNGVPGFSFEQVSEGNDERP
jgi:hypothetical protein